MRSCLVGIALTAGACGSVDTKKPDAAVHDDAPLLDEGGTPDMGDAPSCVTPPAMLKARYRAENNANDHTGAYNGVTTGLNFSYTAGKYGQAFLLDGMDDAVTIDDGDALWPSGSFSLEAWVKTNGTPGSSNTVVCKYGCGTTCNAGTRNAYFCLYTDSTGHPQFAFRPDASDNATILAATLVTVVDGNWHHLVAVRDSTAQIANIYVDGTSAVSATPGAAEFGPMTNQDNETDKVMIGAIEGAGTTALESFFTGAIDDVSIYHSALQQADVTALFMSPQGECN